MAEQKIRTDFNAMIVVELKKCLQEQYFGEEIASAVGQLVVLVGPYFKKRRSHLLRQINNLRDTNS